MLQQRVGEHAQGMTPEHRPRGPKDASGREVFAEDLPAADVVVQLDELPVTEVRPPRSPSMLQQRVGEHAQGMTPERSTVLTHC